ncbi:unnamed protein product, partial [Allacma fusca]
PSVAASPVG